MPERRTQDVVHVVMTDHFIRRATPAGDFLAPLEEHDSNPTEVDLLDPGEAPSSALGAERMLRT